MAHFLFLVMPFTRSHGTCLPPAPDGQTETCYLRKSATEHFNRQGPHAVVGTTRPQHSSRPGLRPLGSATSGVRASTTWIVYCTPSA